MNTVTTINTKMNTLVLHFVLLVQSYLPTTEREEGQGMVEYALIIALIAVVLVAALTSMGTTIKATFDGILSSL